MLALKGQCRRRHLEQQHSKGRRLPTRRSCDGQSCRTMRNDSGLASSSMRSTEAARAAARAERALIGRTQTAEELRDRLIARLGELQIDVIAVSKEQMEGSRAEIDGESGVIKY